MVVLIIGILIAAALPQYKKAVERARATEAVSYATVLMSAVDQYVLAGGYPGTVEGVSVLEGLDVQLPPAKDGDKGITYSAWCFTSLCEIGVGPRDHMRNYWLEANRWNTSKHWNTYCTYRSRRGKSVCEGLKDLGWAIRGDSGGYYWDY